MLRHRPPPVGEIAAARYAGSLARTPQDHDDSNDMAPKVSSDERIAKMSFAAVYPLYVNKIEKKGRTEAELLKVIQWLTGFTKAQVNKHIKNESTIEEFFAAAKLNPNASLITGLICGHRVEEIENPLTQKARYLDKLIDELARGKKMESILRS